MIYLYTLIIFILSLTQTATLLSISGIFNQITVITLSAVNALFFRFVFLRKSELPKIPTIIIFLSLFFSLFYCVAFPSWLPNKRDPSVYMTTAVDITKYKSLINDNILNKPLHGMAQYNLPQGQFTSQFLPAYSSFLAVIFSFFGESGLIRGNFCLVFITLLSMYLVTKAIFNSEKTSLLYLLLLANSFIFVWSTKQLLSENMLMSFIWFSLAIILHSVPKKQSRLLLMGLIFASFLPLIRIEGLAYFIFFVIIGLYFLWTNKISCSIITKTVTIIAIFINLAFFSYYIVNINADYTFLHLLSVLNSVFSRLNLQFRFVSIRPIVGLLIIGTVMGFFLFKLIYEKDKFFSAILLAFAIYFSCSLLITTENPYIAGNTFVIKILQSYTLIAPAIFGLFMLLKNRGIKTKFRFLPIIIFLLLFASIFFLVPGIAIDHPWFTRRYLSVILPILLMLPLLGILLSTKQKLSKFIIAMFFLSNVILSFPIYTYRENNGLKNLIIDIKKEIKPNSIIFFQPGWQWQQISKFFTYIYGVNSTPNFDGFTKEEVLQLANNHNHVYYLSEDKTEKFNEEKYFKGNFSCFQSRSSIWELPPNKRLECRLGLYLYKLSKDDLSTLLNDNFKPENETKLLNIQ